MSTKLMINLNRGKSSQFRVRARHLLGKWLQLEVTYLTTIAKNIQKLYSDDALLLSAPNHRYSDPTLKKWLTDGTLLTQRGCTRNAADMACSDSFCSLTLQCPEPLNAWRRRDAAISTEILIRKHHHQSLATIFDNSTD